MTRWNILARHDVSVRRVRARSRGRRTALRRRGAEPRAAGIWPPCAPSREPRQARLQGRDRREGLGRPRRVGCGHREPREVCAARARRRRPRSDSSRRCTGRVIASSRKWAPRPARPPSRRGPTTRSNPASTRWFSVSNECRARRSRCSASGSSAATSGMPRSRVRRGATARRRERSRRRALAQVGRQECAESRQQIDSLGSRREGLGGVLDELGGRAVIHQRSSQLDCPAIRRFSEQQHRYG